MNRFYIQDMLDSLKKECVTPRYYPLISCRESLKDDMKKWGLTFTDEAEAAEKKLYEKYGEETTTLFLRFLHLYDFNPVKLKDIESYRGKEEYEELRELLRLPGVRRLRAELYYHSGVSLQTLARKNTAEIQNMVKSYIEHHNRPESVPLKKEVETHREVAKIILHAEERLI